MATIFYQYDKKSFSEPNIACKIKFRSHKSEIFQLFDFFLATDPKTRARNLGVRSYHVTPLGPEMGLIEWVADLTSFKGAVCPVYNRKSIHNIQHNYQPQYKNEKKDFELYTKGKCEIPIEKLVFILKFSVMKTMNPPLFHQWFLDRFHTGQSWLKARTTYTNSLAVTSIIGNIIGLGDRHCENIQICKKTGELVHIDLNMIFERGLNLGVPEIVPFRMTPNIIDGCGVTGLDGNFRTIAIMTMRLAKEKEKMLRTVISLFLADPTINWNNFKTRDNKRDSRKETSNAKSLIDVMNRIHCITKDNEALSEAEYLDHLLKSATCTKKLSKMWRGWAPQI